MNIMKGNVDDGEKHLEFMREIHVEDKSSVTAFLEGMVAVRKNGSSEQALKFLDESVKRHIESTKGMI